MIDINKKDVVKPILIKVTLRKTLRNIEKHDNIGCYFEILGYFCIKRFGNPFSL